MYYLDSPHGWIIIGSLVQCKKKSSSPSTLTAQTESVDVITRAAGGVSRRRSIRPSCPPSRHGTLYIARRGWRRCRRELWAILRATNCDGRWLTHGVGRGSSSSSADVVVVVALDISFLHWRGFFIILFLLQSFISFQVSVETRPCIDLVEASSRSSSYRKKNKLFYFSKVTETSVAGRLVLYLCMNHLKNDSDDVN